MSILHYPKKTNLLEMLLFKACYTTYAHQKKELFFCFMCVLNKLDVNDVINAKQSETNEFLRENENNNIESENVNDENETQPNEQTSHENKNLERIL